MSDNQSAVEKLLVAETNAHKMIGAAQKEREKKIKDAKVQANDEILVYRKEKESEFQQLIAQKFGNNNEESQEQARLETELTQIDQEFSLNQDKVTKLLVSKIMDVEITVPQIMKGNFSEYFKK